MGDGSSFRQAANGIHVMVGYRRSAESAADVVTELKRLGGGGTAVQAELEEPDGVSALFDAAASRFGRVDYFVSCAAALLPPPAADYITGQSLAVDGGFSLPAPPFHADMGAALALPPRPVRARTDSGEHRKGTATS